MPVINDFFDSTDLFDDVFGGELGLEPPGPIYVGTRVPQLSLKINGQDVKAEAVSFDSEEGFGFRGLTATITREDALRLNVHQGSEVSVWGSAAECHFDGHLTGPPRLRTDGKADLTCNGWALKAEKRTDPLPYQTRDATLFQDGKDDPFNFAADVRRLETDTKATQLWFRVENGTAITAGDHRSQAIWVPGGILTEISFRKNYRVDTLADNLRVQEFTGPSGAATQLGGDISINSGDGDTITRTGGTEDGLTVRLRVVTSRTPSVNNRIELDRVRVYGRHPDGTGPTVASPTFTARDICSDIATILGFDSTANLADDTQNLMPWWSVDGETFLDTLTTITDLTDDHFGFFERGRLVAGAWDDSPIWYVRNGPHVDLTPNVIHPQVQVSYDSMRGKPRRVLVTDATALAKYGENTYEFELPDPQSDSTLATFVANALLPVVSAETHNGTITTTEYRDASGAIRPYGPRPGHRVCIEDWRPGLSYTARITSTSAAQGEPMTLGVEGAEASIDRILFNAPDKKKGRKRHRSRGRAGGKRKVRR